ncbi:MAG: hypothetical protein ACJ746_26545 [Bryobacteraceae bacterium]
MTASANAVPNFNVASMRDNAPIASRSSNNLRATAKRDSFSQVFRRTSDGQTSSKTDRGRESEKKDGKPAKKADDVNPAVVSDAANQAIEDKPLPINFLLGLVSGKFESFSAEGRGESSTSQIAAEAGSSKDRLQAKLHALLAGAADQNEDPALAMLQAQSLASTDPSATASSDKSDASVATSKGTEVFGIGENGNNAKGAVGILNANTLAFAMRLGSGQALNSSKLANSAEPVSSVADLVQTNFSAASSNAVQAASGSLLEENAHEHEESSQQQNMFHLSEVRTPEPFDTTRITEEHATPSAAQTAAELPSAATAEPVRNVNMQLVSDDNRRVDIRLVDRGGELHVSVKSADTALAQNLQDHLPDLTARLDKQQMQAEVWVPKAAEPGKADGGNTSGSFSDPNARSHSGNNSDGRREGRQQQKPDWVDALENYS